MMFQNSSVMALINENTSLEVRRLELKKTTQSDICKSFADAASELSRNKQIIPFDGSYKPNDDEILSICNFKIPQLIIDAVQNPIALNSLAPKANSSPDIRAVFIGEELGTGASKKTTIAFQRLRKEQYLSTGHINLYFTKNTFLREDRWGIGITDTVDCVYTGTELQFVSYYFARQVFDLSEYYRLATDTEVQDFSSVPLLNIPDKKRFYGMADTWIRRKIATIQDSGILTKYTASEIKKRAKQCGLDVTVTNTGVPHNSGVLG